MGAHDEAPWPGRGVNVVVVLAGDLSPPPSPSSGPATPSTVDRSALWRRQCPTTARTSSSETHGPCSRRATLEEAESRSRSPRPTRRSAPGWSRMTPASPRKRETEKASREGMFALMTPVMTSTEGAARRDHEVDPYGPCHLRDPTDRLFDVALGDPSLRSFSSSTTTSMKGRRLGRAGSPDSATAAPSGAAGGSCGALLR